MRSRALKDSKLTNDEINLKYEEFIKKKQEVRDLRKEVDKLTEEMEDRNEKYYVCCKMVKLSIENVLIKAKKDLTSVNLGMLFNDLNTVLGPDLLKYGRVVAALK